MVLWIINYYFFNPTTIGHANLKYLHEKDFGIITWWTTGRLKTSANSMLAIAAGSAQIWKFVFLL